MTNLLSPAPQARGVRWAQSPSPPAPPPYLVVPLVAPRGLLVLLLLLLRRAAAAATVGSSVAGAGAVRAARRGAAEAGAGRVGPRPRPIGRGVVRAAVAARGGRHGAPRAGRRAPEPAAGPGHPGRRVGRRGRAEALAEHGRGARLRHRPPAGCERGCGARGSSSAPRRACDVPAPKVPGRSGGKRNEEHPRASGVRDSAPPRRGLLRMRGWAAAPRPCCYDAVSAVPGAVVTAVCGCVRLQCRRLA